MVSAERLAQAAFMYYVQGLSQSEVGERLGLSRSNVSRLLTEARQRRIVRFQIDYPVRRDLQQEARLIDRFSGTSLREVVVARPATGDDARAGLIAAARAGGDWLDENLQDGQTVGLFWGSTIQTMVDVSHFSRSVDAHFVQMAGEWSTDPANSGHDLVRDLANKVGGRYTYFDAPAVADTPAVATSLIKSPQVSRALELARTAQTSVLGIGAFDSGTAAAFLTLARATASERDEARRKGAVGQICGRFYDSSGQQLNLALHRRLVSIDLDELRHTRNVVAIASGAEKAEAVSSAILGGLVHTLVADAVLATTMLAA